MSPHSAAVSPPRPKTTLFCPQCGHESPADGDWRLEHAPSSPTLLCPDCETAVHRGCRSAVPTP